MYEVRCLRCDFSAEVSTLGRVFRLEEVHQAESGERHLLEWESGSSAVSETVEAEGGGGGESDGDADGLESTGR